MSSTFALLAGHERHLLAIKPRLAHQQSGGDGYTDPSVFQNVDGETGASGGQVAGDVEIVVHAREGRVGGGRLGIVFDRVCFGAQDAVFIDGDDNPPGGAGGVSGLLVLLGGRVSSGYAVERGG